MNVFVHSVTYAALAVFLIAIVMRFLRIRRYPINMRWEIYPVPHEGKRSAYGGSKMEETDYWKKDHKPDKLTELKYMLQEMVFIKALFEHNRKLWYRSFPFHFGLYLLAGFVGLLVLTALLELAGVPFAGIGATREPSTFANALDSLTILVGTAGFVLTLVGAISLLFMRLTDEELKPYTNPSHIFNLLFIIAAVGLAFGAFAMGKDHVGFFRFYISSLLTFDLDAPVGRLPTALTFVTVSLLIAYIPLTHMAHFFVKWFTWHKIRWDDTANVKGGRIEKMIEQALQYPVSWSADHIRGDGKKTWAQTATEEMPKSE
jgi:nitrate reductase gamma subunit